ncbi:helix-turn-helix domain-containing protein [Pseudarthrobacter sp. HLT3-5]|uniref:helix-turn-helix domain-containing protein n=1 Tax=Pseudarthrobacter cellobiosi TaxID=2953654 RepID=UPI00208FD2B1|nr:helix-turn-helix domain-containing protein [Pseudarthrobacter sp. HLT3-5]MCO4273786.1 helix-turn-helix domain-containing protein [Pseudarthrobacter sp. HLT3-5]
MISVPGVPSQPLQYLTAVANSELSSGTKATCWALASFAHNKTGEAFPSVATLAKAVGLSKAVVSKHTARAEAAGYLHKHIRRNNSILYTITVPVTDEMVITEESGAMDEHGNHLDVR